MRKENKIIKEILQMCFDDSCSINGRLKKKTVLELMKHVNTSA